MGTSTAGAIHGHGMACRVRLLPDLHAGRPGSLSWLAARERGPPGRTTGGAGAPALQRTIPRTQRTTPWSRGTIRDHGTTWRVRLLPDLHAGRPGSLSWLAARERGPPGRTTGGAGAPALQRTIPGIADGPEGPR